MERVQGSERHVCFKVVSGHVINRLRKWDHSLPIDNAVGIMLEVIPQLDHYTLSNAPLEEWYATLKIYGFGAHADTLALATDNEAFLHSDAANPQSAVSPSLQIPTATQPLDDRASSLYRHQTPSARSNHENNDDKDDFSTPGSQDFVDVRLSVRRSPYPPVDQDQQTPRRLAANNSRKPSVESNYSFVTDSAPQSTPRPMERGRLNMGSIRSNDSDRSVQSTPRPMRRGRLNMDPIPSVLVDAQVGNDNALRAGLIVPSIERSDPLVNTSPNESRDGHSFEAAGTLKDDDDMVMDNNDHFSEASPTKWHEVYNEYMSFPRPLRIYNLLGFKLKIVNADRLWALKALRRAEARKEVLFIDKFKEKDRRQWYEAIEHDMEAIRKIVRDAAKPKDLSAPFQSLRSLIDFNEDDGSVVITGKKFVQRRKMKKTSDQEAETAPPKQISGRRMMMNEAIVRWEEKKRSNA